MRSAPGPFSGKPLGKRGGVDSANGSKDSSGARSGSRERDMILAALNQVDKASTWTSQQGSSVGGGSEFVSPDAPTAAEASHPSAPRNTAMPGKDTFPGYEIQREIHRGGQGVVYLANQLATKRRVAIKVMHGGATLGTTGKARFDREVQLLGQMNHPNVVNLHDSGVTSDGSLFCVMDYISGKALDEIMREERRERRGHESVGRSRSRSRVAEINDVESTLRFFAKVCDGVNAAHLKGVVHRDIKPANVRVDQSGEPILVDFGLAKVTAGVESDLDPSNPMTMTGQFIGSLPWASPEQATGSGDAIDLRTDVYSLGVMLYQMLTGGKFPYSVIGNMRDVLDNIQRVEPARPSTIRKQINDEVETIVLKALAKDRDRRYQSAGELGRDIRHYLAGEPIQAKRDSGWYVIKKTMSRHKAVAGFVLGASVIITGSAVGMTAMWGQAEGARAVAVVEKDKAEDNLDAARDLARTMLYDFGDSIKNLRGATKARGIVLEKALEYLALLGEQPDPSDELLTELADAHERVGDLAGNRSEANTGTSIDAMSHYESSRDIRAALLKKSPGDKELAAGLALSWHNIGEGLFKQNKIGDAIAALETGATIASESGASRAHVDIMLTLGEAYLRLSEDAASDDPSLGENLDRAGSFFKTADDTWKAMDSAEAPYVRAMLAYRISQVKLIRGRAMIIEGADPEAAQSLIEESMSLAAGSEAAFARFSENNPASYKSAREHWVAAHHLGQARSGLAALYSDVGREEMAQSEHQEALAGFQRCVEIARRMTVDAANIQAVRDLLVSLNKVGNELLALGKIDEAREAYSESMEQARLLYASDPVALHLRDLGVGQYKLAQTDEQRADAGGSQTERRALLELSLAEYEEARRHFLEYTERGGPGQGLVDIVSGEIERVRGLLDGG